MSANTPEWAVQIQQNIHQLETKLDQLLHHMQKLTPPTPPPTFCGSPCSGEIDAAGCPTYIYLEDGARASHREKQGHHWYSASLGDGQYGEHYLKFRRATPPEGLLIMPPPTPSNPDPDPDKEPSLHDLHTIGRAVHGHDWHKIGPQLVHTHTNGRTDKSTDMQPAELTALIHALQQET